VICLAYFNEVTFEWSSAFALPRQYEFMTIVGLAHAGRKRPIEFGLVNHLLG
jgi:hypothetical protein